MGKRRNNSLRSPQEIKQDMQMHYGRYIKDEQKKPRSIQELKRNNAAPADTASVILRDPGANDARRCYECECTGENGACGNYLLYAVIRGMCKLPIIQSPIGTR